MAATAETDSVHDHMTRLRMKMVQQKIQNEKDRIVNRPPSEESSNNDLENQARLQQAMLRRQELLDKIRREQLMNEEAKRPRSYSARRRYTPSPLPVPPSRRSLPDFARLNMYNQPQDTYRSKPEMSQVKHVIEHKIATPRQQYALPPIQQQQQIQPRPPVIVQQQPQYIPMQQPTPQIIAAPAPQHIITGYPSPVIHNLGQPENKSMFNKADFGEMMMMQNAQMHQMVMQKLMLGSLGHHDTHGSCHDCHSGCCSSHGVHGGCGHGCGHGSVCYDCLPVPRANGSVHHHHYTSPPPSQPAITHYTTLPAMDIRGGYPLRGELLGGYYADPYSYAYEYYQ